MKKSEPLLKLIETIAEQAKNASLTLQSLPTELKNAALIDMAQEILQAEDIILAANQLDLQAAAKQKLSKALIDRLTLTPQRIKAMADSIKIIADLKDPVNQVLSTWKVPSGLTIKKVSMPLGVIGVIYESRPNVTADAAALCFKAGNAVILRGGSEALHSNAAIHQCITRALHYQGITDHAIQFMPTQDHAAVSALLQMDKYIDVIIPRGGNALINNIRSESRIPMFLHLSGLCHTYVHESADIAMAINIILNAKMRRTGICGATETILIDQSILETHAKPIVIALLEAGCEIRGDANIQALDPKVKHATEEDWRTEYLDAIVSIKTVETIHDAISHIQTYGTSHTDAIITEDLAAVKLFFQHINSAIVMHNASTQFADGGEFGMGAEIGIATGKLHARGPIGVEQLTTFHYLVHGEGAVRPG